MTEPIDCPCAPNDSDERAPDNYVLCIRCGARLPPERVSLPEKLCVLCREDERDRS